uniref:Uncharacterized protein n=1 Tax=Digenea simplex TaxID=945030 RepID=A0A1Z1MTL4_DIGSM|nr:hypothetical protein [Digenea simplex]ARW69447.1 hypothetical protein [Digenea simplex]
MLKYWPNQPSINLNNAIVELLLSTEQKIKYDLSNYTQYYLYIDVLNNKSKQKLFKIVLDEFKNLILDLIELNLSKQYLKILHTRILIIFIEKTSQNFLSHEITTTENYVTSECGEIINYLLMYCIFGSSSMDQQLFLFDPIYTPYQHVQVLLENFIIRVSNIITKQAIYRLRNLKEISDFLKLGNKSNLLYTSSRSTVLFLNNLRLQNFINLYINETKAVYNERQQVWLISSRGITCKYIYISKVQKIEKFNQFQIIFLFWLEIKDIIIPRIEKILIQLAKYLIYFLINLFSNLVIILMRIIVFYLNK